MSSRIEENLKEIAEYLKGLSSISYEAIIDMLKDEHNYYQIEFYDELDLLNDIHYLCASVTKNYKTEKTEKYLLVDQEFADVYTNFIMSLKKSEVDTVYEMFVNYFDQLQLACHIGENILLFPHNVANELMANSSIGYTGQADYIPCGYQYFELGIPICLSPSSESRTKIKK